MNDEQRRVTLFQPQPCGPQPILRLTALSLAHVPVLHITRAALPTTESAGSSSGTVSVNRP